MVLYIYLFDSKCAGHTDIVLQWLMFPMSWSVNFLLSSFKSTTKERADREEAPCYERYVILTFLVPLLIIAICVTAPIAFIAFLCWIPLQKTRHPFRYSCQNTSKEIPPWNEGQSPERLFRVSSLNVSLFPGFSSRQINLAQTLVRARQITNSIVESQNATSQPVGPGRKRSAYGNKASDPEEVIVGYQRTMPNQMAYENLDQDDYHSVCTDFPQQLDVVCLQGVFDFRAQQETSRLLHGAYPHIVCDVTLNSWHTNQYQFGSGLITASRYPVGDGYFHCYTNAVGEDTKRAKGVLFIKLEIGSTSEGKKLVGLVANTHLQDGYGFAGVRTRQLNELRQRRRQFLESTLKEGEIVVFDVLCGNLGFDNLSTADRENWTHDLLKEYKDPCRSGPGKDMPSSLGTYLVISKIHDAEVSTPAGMKSMLEDSNSRSEYVQSAEIEGRLASGDSGRDSGTNPTARRRINAILLGAKISDAAYDINVREFNVITQLTGMTVHLPISCGFVVMSAKQ